MMSKNIIFKYVLRENVKALSLSNYCPACVCPSRLCFFPGYILKILSVYFIKIQANILISFIYFDFIKSYPSLYSRVERLIENVSVFSIKIISFS